MTQTQIYEMLIIFISSIIVVQYIYFRAQRKVISKRHNLIVKQMELQKNYIIHMVKGDKKMKKFRHDFNSHVNMLTQYSQKGEFDKLNNYLKRMTDESALGICKGYTGNLEVDTIIYSLSDKLEASEIELNTQGKLPMELDIEQYDVCSLVQNLLKNAIEACEKIGDKDKRNISLRVGVHNRRLFLSILNPTKDKMVMKDNKIKTTKKCKKEHGLGTQIIYDIVKKYNGDIQINNNENYVEIEIIV